MRSATGFIHHGDLLLPVFGVEERSNNAVPRLVFCSPLRRALVHLQSAFPGLGLFTGWMVQPKIQTKPLKNRLAYALPDRLNSSKAEIIGGVNCDNSSHFSS